LLCEADCWRDLVCARFWNRGTLTPILGHFGLFGLAAGHCVLPPNQQIDSVIGEIDVLGYPLTSCLTSRRLNKTPEKIGVFTKACLGFNDEDDVAVVMLSENHAYLVNELVTAYTINLMWSEKLLYTNAECGNINTHNAWEN
jgi:hypothetical protein